MRTKSWKLVYWKALLNTDISDREQTALMKIVRIIHNSTPHVIFKWRRKVYISLKDRKHGGLFCETFATELFLRKQPTTLCKELSQRGLAKFASEACFEMPSKMTIDRRWWPQCHFRCVFVYLFIFAFL